VKLLFLFGALWWLLGNPIVAILIVLVILYVLERRFIGLTPSIARPLRRRGAIARWKRHLHMSPHDLSAKTELVRLLIEAKKYREAREMLLGMQKLAQDSAEYWSDLGICELALGRLEEGEQAMLKALEISPRVKYGQPYLRLGEAWAKKDPDKALSYLEKFKTVNSSSCEAYYRLGQIYASLGKRSEAAKAFRECRQLYFTLPRYLKRKERRWVLLAWLQGAAKS
jgi:tetratricopeptide (TPR) repeat protein